MVNERTDRVEKLAKSNLTEVTTFLHTVHSDFEAFLSKHKKEHNNLNMRLLKVTEDMSAVLLQFKPIKQTIDKFATTVACLVEFNSIEHALALQDEADREDMQLVAKTKQPKLNDKGFTPRYLNMLQVDATTPKYHKEQKLKAPKISVGRAGTVTPASLKATV